MWFIISLVVIISLVAAYSLCSSASRMRQWEDLIQEQELRELHKKKKKNE